MMQIKESEILLKTIVCIFVSWLMLSILSSAAKMDLDNCGKTYPIDYIFYTNAFCEIKFEDQG
jgi:hypothetical protein